jgi:predicted MFS family arabinose efflux permease
MRRPPIHYAWLMVLVTFVTLITTAGFRATPGVLIVPLQDEFGWSRATISLAVSIGLLLYGLTAPFSAALMERFGVRRVMLCALATIACGASLTTVMDAPWQLDLLWGVVVGSATGAVAVPLAAIVADRWFETRRGFVTGILTASNASGQMVFLPVLAVLTTAFGWRWAALCVAGVAVLVVFPVVAVAARDRPQQLGLEPYGATEPVPAPERAARPFRPAIDGLLLGIRSRSFWLLAATFFVCGLSTNGLIGTHLIPAAQDHGMSAVRGASLLALMGVFDVVGTTLSGWLTDRVDPRRLLCWYYAFRGLAVIALPYAFGSTAALVVFAVFYGLDWVATVPPTVALAAESLGRARVGIVFGWIFAAHQIGAAFAAWAGGATRSWLGSYTAAFVGAGVLCLLAAGLSLRIERDERVGVAEPLPSPV